LRALWDPHFTILRKKRSCYKTNLFS